MQRICVLLVAGLSLLLGGQTTLAQSGVATPSVSLTAPDPATCTVAPRAASAILALVGTPLPSTPVPGPPSPTPITPPAGQPADAATVQGVTATVHALFACLAGGDLPRAAALFTANGLRQFLSVESIAQIRAETAGPPRATPAAARVAVGVQGVHRLSDGRVGAYVDGRSAAGTFSTFTLFVKQGDHYLVDALLFQGAPFQPGGTPTPVP